MQSATNHTLVSIFDGHGGSGAALFAADNLVRTIQGINEWKQYVESGENNVEKLGDSLANAYLELDMALRRKQENGPYGEDSSGCTAVSAMITPKYIVCANSGDSRCVLGHNNMTKDMSEDHKPYGEIERKRIEASGGTVQFKRVDGDLAVSRALGDFQYKQRPDLPARDQKVIITYLRYLGGVDSNKYGLNHAHLNISINQ